MGNLWGVAYEEGIEVMEMKIGVLGTGMVGEAARSWSRRGTT